MRNKPNSLRPLYVKSEMQHKAWFSQICWRPHPVRWSTLQQKSWNSADAVVPAIEASGVIPAEYSVQRYDYYGTRKAILSTADGTGILPIQSTQKCCQRWSVVMLAFIDESGHPQPGDPTHRPVVVAVCFDERNARAISGQIHAIKRDVLQRERTELKARNIINRNTYRRRGEARAFAEDFFAALRNLDITVFGIIMEAPFAPQQKDNLLENRFRFLLQRIELLAEERDTMANILFDGDSGQLKGLSARFSSYLYRSAEGRGNIRIADTPAFVDSESSVGIQIADMCAYVMRVYQENRSFSSPPPLGDEYLVAIRRWYRIIEDQTRDLTAENHDLRRGIYFMAQGDR